MSIKREKGLEGRFALSNYHGLCRISGIMMSGNAKAIIDKKYLLRLYD